MRLILIRHGETNWTSRGKFQGATDIGLNEKGRRQCRLLALSLRGQRIDAVYSSDLKRAAETAREIASYHGLPVWTDSDLREMNYGVLEELTSVELKEKYPDILSEWLNNPEKVRIPDGESIRQVQKRAFRAIQKIYKKYYSRTVVVVSHNITIKILLCRFTGRNFSEFLTLKLHPSSKSVVVSNDRPEVKVLNDVTHLSTGSDEPK
jgi:broad specificity phosphatase PhoE